MENHSDELDELDEIEKQGASEQELTLSNVYNIKIGGFGTTNSIKTYLCTVKVDDLEDDIEFYETLTKDKSWPVSQIIQREVDRIRVSNISKDYILGLGRPIKYFPPIIIAILPKGPDGKIDLKLNYTPESSAKIKELIYDRSVFRKNEKIKKYFTSGTNKSLIDGLYVLEVSKIFDFNLFCWDKAKYYAIVIDGQHRLASLFKSKKDNPVVANYTQDVVFMDFSYLIQTHEEKKYTPIEVVRRVFIDINTNAKKVGLVRQILMDDKDLTSLLVQSMVDAVNKDGSDKATDSYLISQIVDWYGESLKHVLPHITGILSLYQILDDYLIQGNVSSIEDLRSKKKINAWVSRMNDIFMVDTKIKVTDSLYSEVTTLEKSLEKYNSRVEDNEIYGEEIQEENKETEIFSFDYNVLDVAQETFTERFLRPLIKVFNNLTPYKETLEIIKEEQGLESSSLLNKALISSGSKLANEKILRESLHELRKKLESRLYSKYYHIFTVLGQKVIFSLLFQRILYDYNSNTSEKDVMGITDGFINEINRMLEIMSSQDVKLFDKKENVSIDLEGVDDDLIDLGTITTSFWEGIIYEDGKIIYNTQGIKSLSSLIHYILVRLDEIIQGNEQTRPFIVAYLHPRIKRILKRKFSGFDETLIARYSEEIVKTKETFLENYLQSSVLAWKEMKSKS